MTPSHSEIVSLEDPTLISDVLNELAGSIETFLVQTSCLGTIRPEPQRVYVLDRLARLHWERRDLGVLLDFLAGNIDYGSAKELDKWLARLDLATRIVSTPEAIAGGLVSQILIYETKDDPPVNLADFGFGTSQVLPVLLQSLLAKPGSVVIIEQPELYLHPNAQAHLADLFAAAIYTISYEGPEPRAELSGVRFLIETHSEHLFLRLRRRIAETTSRRDKPSTRPHKF